MIFAFVVHKLNLKNVVVGNMNKKDLDALNKELVIADILLRITVLEKFLISKNIVTSEEYQEAISSLSDQVAKTILKNAQVPGDADQIINDLKSENKSQAEN